MADADTLDDALDQLLNELHDLAERAIGHYQWVKENRLGDAERHMRTYTHARDVMTRVENIWA